MSDPKNAKVYAEEFLALWLEQVQRAAMSDPLTALTQMRANIEADIQQRAQSDEAGSNHDG